eukprot:scaffold104672_cov36-Prasinocladus_malaysianus.AAC.3
MYTCSKAGRETTRSAHHRCHWRRLRSFICHDEVSHSRNGPNTLFGWISGDFEMRTKSKLGAGDLVYVRVPGTQVA